MLRLLGMLALWVALVGCVGPSRLGAGAVAAPPPASPMSAPQSSVPPQPDALPASLKEANQVVDAARNRLEYVRGPGDCVVFLREVFRDAGTELPELGEPGDNAVTALYRAANAEGRTFTGRNPEPGDIAFFRETYDRNRDGERNDGLTHVALVESVDETGTVALLHRGSRGAARIWMDLAHPDQERDPMTGKVWNAPIRKGPVRPRLTGELFFAYARFLPPLYARAVRSQVAPCALRTKRQNPTAMARFIVTK